MIAGIAVIARDRETVETWQLSLTASPLSTDHPETKPSFLSGSRDSLGEVEGSAPLQLPEAPTRSRALNLRWRMFVF